MDNELIKLIKQERPTGRMGNNNEPVWNAAKVYDLMVKAQQQVKSVDLADVGGSLQPVKELIEKSAENYIEEYKPPHGLIAGAIEQAYKIGAIDMYKHLSQ